MIDRESDDQNGMALLGALLAGAFVAGLGLCLVLVADTERLTAASFKWGNDAMAGADAMLDWATVDLAALADWTTLPGDARLSAFVDASRVPTTPAGDRIDLDALTTDVQAETDALGSGPDRPLWRLYAWDPLDRLAGLAPPAASSLLYGAVWIADDPFDGDGAPAVDTNGAILVHAEAFGPAGARRAVEAVLARLVTEPPPGGDAADGDAGAGGGCGIRLASYVAGWSHSGFDPQFRQAAYGFRSPSTAAWRGRDAALENKARPRALSGFGRDSQPCESGVPAPVRRVNWREVR